MLLTIIFLRNKMLVYEQFKSKQTNVLNGLKGKRGEESTENVTKCRSDCSDDRNVGHIIKELNNALRKKFLTCGTEAGLDEVTMMHGWIMGYLHHNQDREIYQKTIESEFGIRRSTVTTILQLMEKKGYITREAVEGDARLKKIVLTEPGTETAIRTKSMLDTMEKCLTEGIGKDKLEIFLEVAEKLIENMNQ